MNNADSLRFKRQIDFAPLGQEGQHRLEAGRVLLVGCGALGGTVADLLVRAGVGAGGGVVAIFDFDVVHRDNLHRQTLFTESDADHSLQKVDAAKQRLLAANGGANVQAFSLRFDESDSHRAEQFDLIIDATDNFRTRFVLNAAAVRYRKPLISGGIAGAAGQTMTVFPGRTACLACLLDSSLPEPAAPPVLGPLPQICASMQALEAIKILSGNAEAVSPSLRWFDLWNGRYKEFPLTRNPRCTICAE